jgi:hypothetical protein
MVFLLGKVARVATSYQQAGGAVAPLVPLLFLAVFALAVWLVWAFIRLRPLARWLCVCFFAYWAISATWGMTRLLLRADSPGPITTLGMGVLAVMWLAIVIPNIASIVYLFSGRCRAFALWYLQEKHREGMQRYAQKQVEKDLKS